MRALLVELDDAFTWFGQQTKALADGSMSASEAIQVGADREAQRAVILGIAWRINQASKRKGATGAVKTTGVA